MIGGSTYRRRRPQDISQFSFAVHPFSLVLLGSVGMSVVELEVERSLLDVNIFLLGPQL